MPRDVAPAVLVRRAGMLQTPARDAAMAAAARATVARYGDEQTVEEAPLEKWNRSLHKARHAP